MRKELSELIRVHLVQICEDLETPELVLYLHTNGIFTKVKARSYRETPKSFERNIDVIMDIQKLDDNALTLFIRGLVKSGQTGLLESLIKDFNADQHSALIDNDEFKVTPENIEGNQLVVRVPNFTKLDQNNIPQVEVPNDPQLAETVDKEMFNKLENWNKVYAEAEMEAYESVDEPCGVIQDLEVSYVDNADNFEYDTEKIYQCNLNRNKGTALVINNYKFTSGLSERLGSVNDKENMSNLLKKMGYNVLVGDNLTGQQMIGSIQYFAQLDDHKTADSSVVVILSHGEHGFVCSTDGIQLSVEYLVSMLGPKNCPALKGKPKLFFIQACRGASKDFGARVPDIPQTDGGLVDSFNSVPDKPAFMKIVKKFDRENVQNTEKILRSISETHVASGGDVVIAFSTTPGYVSWRSTKNGSWFIQAICEVFAKHAKEYDICRLLIEVNNKVSKAFQAGEGEKQIPDPCIRLTKSFYFYPTKINA